MAFQDDDLQIFAAEGAPPLPSADAGGVVDHEGARIWWASYGEGPAVILLHGGMGHSGNWSWQLPALAGYRAVLIDSRGHGRSTRDDRPYSYELMARDVAAGMDAAGIERAALVGWSDGACTALVLADQAPERVAGVAFFACNMDASGTKEIDGSNPLLGRCFGRHVADYAALSATPDGFKAMTEAVQTMQSTQPDYTPEDLARIQVPVTVLQAEHDEFIRSEHAAYLARTIPGAELVELPGVSHFAPLQRPALFNAALSGFLTRVWSPGA
ncbi:alpha/beta fold hydrolase [Phenylobacterium aquaticum]|uniref:alpha/beta fold hydrolase n=1 Tax=Phenylobacterium aquaticum TaxID=1763816 RepID=UPI001F5CDC85|nr:alpha/beta hydrolase [Phenylobacterium aquaticum]MCI3135119.1 alpha/beta hydrolase [Phenylobacterium aquaticum]